MEECVSGMVLAGTDRVDEMAERLAKTFWRSGHCGIAIANDTKHTMLAPQRYVNSGCINTLPTVIEPGKTGLFSAVKTFISPYGTAGVVTYEFETTNTLDLPPHMRFQLMWLAPFYTNVADCQVNVAVDTMSANQDLWDKMIRDYHGELIRAKNTVHTFQLKQGFKAVVYMGDRGPTPLSVTLTRNNRANISNTD